MIAEHQDRLIQDVLEGEATPAQATELKRLLESSAEVRARYEELGEVFRVLSEAPAVDPPAGLHDAVMNAIAAEPRHSAIPVLARRPRTRGLIPVLSAFVAGAVAATLIVVAVVRGPDANRPVGGAPESGTMAPVESLRGPVLSRATLTPAGGRVELVARHAGSSVWLEVHARLARPVDLDFEFPADGLGLTGVQWSRATVGQSTVGAGSIVLRNVATGEVVLTFTARGTSDVPVRVRAGDAAGVLLHTAPQPPGG